MDIFLSHDWPQHVASHGNMQELISKKRFLQDELQSGSLGSPPNERILSALQPSYWFAAHLHVKFAAVVKHAQRATFEPYGICIVLTCEFHLCDGFRVASTQKPLCCLLLSHRARRNLSAVRHQTWIRITRATQRSAKTRL